MNGELRTVRLPSETSLAGFYIFPDKIAIAVYFPHVIVSSVSMVFLLKQAIRKQVIASDKDRCAYRIIIVLRYIDSFIPNAKTALPVSWIFLCGSVMPYE